MLCKTHPTFPEEFEPEQLFLCASHGMGWGWVWGEGVLFPVRMGSGEGAVPFPRKFFLGFCMEIMHFDAFLHK